MAIRIVSNKKLVAYYQNVLNSARLNMNACLTAYNDSVKARLKYRLTYKEDSKLLADKVHDTYLRFALAYRNYLVAEQSFYNVKGVSKTK